MLVGAQVSSDLSLDTIQDCIPVSTPWGAQEFRKKFDACVSDPKEIKRQQMPLLALYTEKKLCASIQSELKTIKPDVVDDIIHTKDNRISEMVGQVLWKPGSFGSFLNGSPLVLNTLITWKTLVLPGFAILMPLIAIVVPFFLLKFFNKGVEVNQYLEHMKSVILNQISVPHILKSRHADDKLGFVFESLFVGLTLAMFISSLWNQITTSLHLRTIWNDIAERGAELQTLCQSGRRILNLLKSVSIKKQRILRHVLEEGETALAQLTHLEGLDAVATFGTIWNDASCIQKVIAWIAHVDVVTAIAQLDGICFPRQAETLDIQGVYHPAVKSCVSNNLSCTNPHTLLTGPNRGGKSTFCKAVGLAVLTAQSWGFAWAKRMTWKPFRGILTALEPCGKLGVASTFEAEIEFAKDVLAVEERPLFVMMDEIFHSTNAGDGVEASKVFMNRLYLLPGVVSIISTHYKELATTFSDAQKLQLVAHTGAEGRLTYTYTVAPGISEKSSVMEILVERGLVTAVAPPK
jgi:hypothetical protein